jgi:hypothetical protein
MSVATAAFYPLPGYPTKVGQKNVEVADFVGPKSYANGIGMQVLASTLGFGGFEVVDPIGRSLSGTYQAVVCWPVVAAGTFPSPGSQNNFFMKVIVVATGDEVDNAVDLSGELFRLEMWMN